MNPEDLQDYVYLEEVSATIAKHRINEIQKKQEIELKQELENIGNHF